MKPSKTIKTFNTIEDVAFYLWKRLEQLKQDKNKKHILLFAYNGIGKTRLSMAFKEQVKQGDKADTLYFNAFTEDLFTWDNDLENDRERVIKLNLKSNMLKDIAEGLEIKHKIRENLNFYAEFDFDIDFDEGTVRFSREEQGKEVRDIKISRGEENIFIWCLFLVIVRLAMDKTIEVYKRVEYIYIDDPISSLDENHAVEVAFRLAQLLKEEKHALPAIISSHHPLFFDVLRRRLGGKAEQYFLFKDKGSETYRLKQAHDIPFFYHIAMLAELKKATKSGELYPYHFNIFRNILEKTASFHGYEDIKECLKEISNNDSNNDVPHKHFIDIMNHGGNSLYEPIKMGEDNKKLFCQMLRNFLEKYDFNTKSLSELVNTEEDALS